MCHARAGESDGEELSEDSTDGDGLETIVRGHGDGNDLSLVAHLSRNEHHGEEHVGMHTAAAESLELSTSEFHGQVLVSVVVVDTVLIGLGVLDGVEA